MRHIILSLMGSMNESTCCLNGGGGSRTEGNCQVSPLSPCVLFHPLPRGGNPTVDFKWWCLSARSFYRQFEPVRASHVLSHFFKYIFSPKKPDFFGENPFFCEIQSYEGFWGKTWKNGVWQKKLKRTLIVTQKFFFSSRSNNFYWIWNPMDAEKLECDAKAIF